MPDLIKRYFFLFEPKPHLFLALEVKDINNFELIKNKISQIQRPNFIASYEIKENTGDDGHNEVVLDLFYAYARYVLFRITDDYKPGYYKHDETFLVHCFLNPLFASTYSEMVFHLKCATERRLPLNLAEQCLQLIGFQGDIKKFLTWDLAK